MLGVFLTTASGIAYFSQLNPEQQLVRNWISDDSSSESESHNDPSTTAVAPEIDAASGTNAIALLTGILLLAGERSRSRRS